MSWMPGMALEPPAGIFKNEKPTQEEPMLDLELSAETFFKQGIRSRRNFMGLAAIMLEAHGDLHPQLSFTGAMGFDSSLWQHFLNTPAAQRYQPQRQTELAATVEQFFIRWVSNSDHFSVAAGRMLSGINYASSSHQANDYFNFNPRIFTEYWGDNGGLILDGIQGQWQQQSDLLTSTLSVEAAKNGYDSEQLILTTILDIELKAGSMDFSTRWFGYLDHQDHDHPFLKWHAPDHATSFVCRGLGFNAWGAAVHTSWSVNGQEKAILQLQLMNRKLGDSFMTGNYAFLVWNHNQRTSSSLMFQHLERPVFAGSYLEVKDEKGVIFGLSYLPLPGHRLCLEYNYFQNSSFYANMIVAKWNFFITL